jgi:uncharacterized protein YcbK (DUF882 family)
VIRRGISILALAGLLGAVALVFAFRPRAAPAALKAPVANVMRPMAAPSSAPTPPPPSRFMALPPLRFENQTTHARLETRLYDAAGNIDEGAAARLDELLCDGRDPKHPKTARINRRTLQLLFKAAYHFAIHEVEVVSAYRAPGRRREGFHGKGDAIDFRLKGLDASRLAAYLRLEPRSGVGIYTHPKTQYVHLDSRDQSFHWLDASPPRRRWREKSIGAPDLAERDRDYLPQHDLPQFTAASPR